MYFKRSRPIIIHSALAIRHLFTGPGPRRRPGPSEGTPAGVATGNERGSVGNNQGQRLSMTEVLSSPGFWSQPGTIISAAGALISGTSLLLMAPPATPAGAGLYALGFGVTSAGVFVSGAGLGWNMNEYSERNSQ